ncbi:MAG TPA: TonB-dependent receptor [Candidatus Acidoferrales bacterium]|nr:TonB-dependent receptor [Candidatus Acidoferrales bacterium]
MNSARRSCKRGGWLTNFVQLMGGIFAVLLLCAPAFPQGSAGRILGTITDQSGGVVAGATVTVLDVDRGTSRVLTTDDAGAYNAPNLTPGNYTVRVEAKGFKRIERQKVVVEVGHEYRVDLIVQPGEQTQTVTVTEAVPLVETTNATMGGTLENADIVDLPLNGRDYQNLLSLRPGVQLYPGGGPWTQSANGTRPDESVWMVDGVINFNPFDARPVMNMPGPFQDAATVLPIDAIQEFNVMENPKAEYGWKSGAIVNVGIRAGTNSLHGTAYAFGRTTSWDARNYYNVGPVNGTCITGVPASCDQVPVAVKQFGATAGGPIKKDKLFFFGGYEGFRDSIGDDYSLTVPATQSVGNPSLSMVDAITALQAAGIPVSQVSLSAAGCTLAPVTCTGGLYPQGQGTSNSFLSTFPITSHSDNGIGKLDYHLNDKNTLSGTFWYSKYNALGEDHGFVNQAFTDFTPITAWTTDASWVYTPNSSVVNELRFGYDRVSFDFVNFDIGSFANGTGAYNYINTGATIGGFPTVNISGFAPLGTNSNRPQFNDGNPYYDIQDSLSYLKGKHTIKFGGEFTHSEADTAIPVGGRGVFHFNGGAQTIAGAPSTSLEDFFAGTPSAPGAGVLLTGNANIRATWMTGSGFIQDDWRATPKLIVNLGLRYGYTTPMKAANNAFGNFDPAIGLTQEGSSGLGIGGDWHGYSKAFDPRIGFAYDISGKGTTVIRGGFSIVHTLEWPELSFNGQFGLQNDGSTSLAADPTGAVIQCVAPNVCPGSGGGSITLGAATFAASQLCWDPSIGSGLAHTTACGAGQKTIFPVAKTPLCGDGLPNPALPSGSDAPPCDIMGVNPNLADPYVMNYNLSVTHQIGSDLSIEIAYVGNRGRSLLYFTDANQAPLGAAYTAQGVQASRPFYSKFPYLGFINIANNGGYSNYNSLQTTITKRMSHGLSFVAGYTYAHGLDNGSINRFGPLPQDSTNLAAEYGNSDFDIRHRLTLTTTYNIPGVKGYGQLLEGWQINAIYSYSTPQPWDVWDPGNNISGTGESADRWDIAGNPLDFPAGKNSIPYCSGFATTPTCGYTTAYVGGNGLPFTGAAATTGIGNCMTHAPSAATLNSFGCFISTNGNSVLVPPALGTFGNMGRNIFRDAGFNNLDMSIFKNFTLRERYGFQFRWEVFNVLNHPIPANPYGSSSFVNAGNTLNAGGPLGFAGVTNDFAAGNPLIGSGSQRVMQVGLKITF